MRLDHSSNWHRPLIIAHRGASGLAPENTLAAFRLGASHGYRAFECDVKLSADGVPFLLHDDTLERTTNGQGRAGDQPWTALSRLDAGSWHSAAYAGEPLASFEAIAAYCLRNGFALIHYSIQQDHLHLMVEVKDRRKLSRGLQALGIRLAKALNSLWHRRRGSVFAERYFAAALKDGASREEALCAVVDRLIEETVRGTGAPRALASAGVSPR